MIVKPPRKGADALKYDLARIPPITPYQVRSKRNDGLKIVLKNDHRVLNTTASTIRNNKLVSLDKQR